MFLEEDLGKWTINRSQTDRDISMAAGVNKGYEKKPLLDIPFENCPVDYLHLCKGVINKQLNQV